MSYAELQVTTHFSFLRGASSPEELFRQAALLGLPALGIVDRNSVGGVVRSLVAAEQFSALGVNIRMIAGCRLDLVDGSSVLVWPEDRAAWARLTRLLTLGKSRADSQHGALRSAARLSPSGQMMSARAYWNRKRTQGSSLTHRSMCISPPAWRT